MFGAGRLPVAAMLAWSLTLLDCGGGVKTSAGGTGTGTATSTGGVHPTGGTTGAGPSTNPEIAVTAFMPQIDFALPFTDDSAQAIQGANLAAGGSALPLDSTATATGTGTGAATAGNDILEVWTRRLDGQIRRTNSLLAILDKSGTTTTGSFVKRGDGTLAATIKALSGDPTYAYDALICRSGKPLTHVRWSVDMLSVAFERFDAAGAGSEIMPTDLTTNVVYVKSASGTTVDYNADGLAVGTPYGPEGGIEGQGARVTEAIHGVRAPDGTVTLRGVNAWHDGPTLPAAADGYLTGTLAPQVAGAAPTGEFCAYRRLDTADCTTPFNEALPASPGWCLGRDLAQTTRFDAAARAAAWVTLTPIGIESLASLKLLPGPDPAATCPTADGN